MSSHTADPWMTSADVAKRVSMAAAWVERSARAGSIPRHKVGKSVRWCDDCIAEISSRSYRASRPVPRVTTSRRRRAA